MKATAQDFKELAEALNKVDMRDVQEIKESRERADLGIQTWQVRNDMDSIVNSYSTGSFRATHDRSGTGLVYAILFMLAVLFFIAIVADANAAPRKVMPIQYMVTEGENGITCKEGRALFYKVQGFYRRNLNVNLHFSRLFCEKINEFGVQRIADTDPFFQMISYYFNQRYLNWKYISHAVLPPIKDEGIYYIGGVASGICDTKGGFSYSNAGVKRSNGLPFKEYNFWAMAHEIGHLVGMKHDDAEYQKELEKKLEILRSFMHPDALHYYPNLIISDKNRKEIGRCVR